MNRASCSARLHSGGIVVDGRENIRQAIEERVRGKYQRRFSRAGIIGYLLVRWRIQRVVERKLKKFDSPYSCY